MGSLARVGWLKRILAQRSAPVSCHAAVGAGHSQFHRGNDEWGGEPRLLVISDSQWRQKQYKQSGRGFEKLGVYTCLASKVPATMRHPKKKSRMDYAPLSLSLFFDLPSFLLFCCLQLISRQCQRAAVQRRNASSAPAEEATGLEGKVKSILKTDEDVSAHHHT